MNEHILIHSFIHSFFYRGILTEQVNLSEHVPGCAYLNLSDPSPDPWPEPEPQPEPELIIPIPVSQWKCSRDPEFAPIGSSVMSESETGFGVSGTRSLEYFTNAITDK